MSSERLTLALKRLIRETFPRLSYVGFYEYRIAAQNGTRFDCRPASSGLGLPDLVGVDVRPSLAGSASDLALNSLVLIGFANSDPSKPFIAWAEPDESSGFEPTETRINASGDLILQDGSKKVARDTDPVAIGTLTVSGVPGVLLQFIPDGFTGTPPTPTAAVVLTGAIDGGADRVKA